MGPERLGPHFDLGELHEKLHEYVFRSGVIARAQKLTLSSHADTVAKMREVMMSLTPGDFYRAHVEAYSGRGTVRLDAYAKFDDCGLWFVKFDIEEELIVHSCHESRDDTVVLHNGSVLRK